MKLSSRNIIFLLLIINSACSPGIRENEPKNNSLKGAMPIQAGKTYEGNFYSEKNADIDFYFIETETTTMITGELSAVKGVDSSISFYNDKSQGPFKIINDGQSSMSEKFGPIQMKAPGIWIAISSSQLHSQKEYKKLFYKFKFTQFIPPSFMEKEGNDSPALAQKFYPDSNGLMLGYYNNSFFSQNELERDFFVYEIPESGKVLVDISLSAVEKIDAVLRVYDSSGVLLMIADERGISESENIRSLAVNAPTKLTISVNSKDFLTNFSQYYQLKVSHRAYESRFEAEPNDSKETASLLVEERTFGELSDAFDKDFFRIRNIWSNSIFTNIEVIPSVGLDIILKVFLPNGETLEFNDAEIERTEGFSNLFLESNEILYFSIQSKENFPAQAAEYSVIYHVIPDGDNLEKENNNTAQKANTILLNSEYMGYINPNNDIDFFKIKSEKNLRVKILSEGIENCTMQISVADSDGIILNSYQSSKHEGISTTASLPPNAVIKVECLESKKNLYSSPYNIKLIEVN